MIAALSCRASLNAYMRPISRSTALRTLTTTIQPSESLSSTSTPTTEANTATQPPNTHFKITLRRSAISLGDKIKGTLEALGIHRRFQTVYFPHSPEVAGKILRVKELVEVENVPREKVLTKRGMREERKATRGYKVVGSRRGVDGI